MIICQKLFVYLILKLEMLIMNQKLKVKDNLEFKEIKIMIFIIKINLMIQKIILEKEKEVLEIFKIMKG